MRDFSQVPDILMMVGVTDYPWPLQAGKEYKQHGFSKRISRSAIPAIVPGGTYMAPCHPRALAWVTNADMSMWDLSLELYTEYGNPGPDFVADNFDPISLGLIDEEGERNTLALTDLLDEAEQAKELDDLVEKYGLRFEHGVFGYGPIISVQFIALTDDPDEELPDDLKGKPYVEIVRDIYDDEEEICQT